MIVASRLMNQLGSYHLLPPRPAPNTADSSFIEMLPFLDEKDLAKEIAKNPTLDPAKLAPGSHRRPRALTCPSAPAIESTIPTVPAAHYKPLADVPYGFLKPWLVRSGLPEDYESTNRGPHAGGFNVGYDDFNLLGGSVQFVIGGGT
jgi:hypothetical protein